VSKLAVEIENLRAKEMKVKAKYSRLYKHLQEINKNQGILDFEFESKIAELERRLFRVEKEKEISNK
jgi:hypothetical protein